MAVRTAARDQKRIPRGVWLAVVLCACSEPEPEQNPASNEDVCVHVARARVACELPTQRCETPEEHCRAKCLVGWGCAELADPRRDPGVDACFGSCEPRFTCKGGLEVYESFRCDGVGDCPEADDEEGCTPGIAPSSHDVDANGSVEKEGGPFDAMVSWDGSAALDGCAALDGSAAMDSSTPPDGSTEREGNAGFDRDGDSDADSADSSARALRTPGARP